MTVIDIGTSLMIILGPTPASHSHAGCWRVERPTRHLDGPPPAVRTVFPRPVRSFSELAVRAVP